MAMDIFIGHKFGDLTILDFEHRQDKRQRRWYAKCNCDCGTEKWIAWANIKAGKSQSCGCKTFKNLVASNRRKSKDWYETRAEEIFVAYEDNPHLTIYDIAREFGVSPQRIHHCITMYDPDKTTKERSHERKMRVCERMKEWRRLVDEREATPCGSMFSPKGDNPK